VLLLFDSNKIGSFIKVGYSRILRKMAEKELTSREVAKMNLEDRLYQDVLASNGYQVGVEKGERGIDSWLQGAYGNVTSDETFSKEREKVYSAKKKALKDSRVYGEPSMPTDGDIAHGMIDTINLSLEQISLSDLYSVITSIDSDAQKYTLPEKGHELSKEDIIKEAKEKGAIVEKDGKPTLDIKKLSPEYQEAYIALNQLIQIYEDSCTERLRSNRRQKSFETLGKIRDEQFHPKEESTE